MKLSEHGWLIRNNLANFHVFPEYFLSNWSIFHGRFVDLLGLSELKSTHIFPVSGYVFSFRALSAFSRDSKIFLPLWIRFLLQLEKSSSLTCRLIRWRKKWLPTGDQLIDIVWYPRRSWNVERDVQVAHKWFNRMFMVGRNIQSHNFSFLNSWISLLLL